MEDITQNQARQYLQENKISIGPDDYRSVVEIASAFMISKASLTQDDNIRYNKDTL